MTKERLQEIRELRAENWFIYNPNNEVNECIDELIAEIDSLTAREEDLGQKYKCSVCGSQYYARGKDVGVCVACF